MPLLHKISLVSKSGLTLAEYPHEEDVEKSQLAGGIMSALLSFSKEVHDKELESLSYDDRQIFFLPIHDFFLVLEISSDFNETLIRNVVEELRSSGHALLHSYQSDTITVNDAIYITDELANMAQSIELMNEFGDLDKKYILTDPKLLQFKLLKTRDTYSVVATSDSLDIANIISRMVLNGNLEFNDDIKCKSGIIRLKNGGAFVVVKPDTGSFDIGIMVIEEEEVDSLVALSKKLRSNTKKMVEKDDTLPIPILLQKLLENSHANRTDFLETKSEFVSLSRLDKDIKDLEKILFCISNSERIIVTGERAYVKIIVNTLSLFGLHRPISIIEWMEANDKLDRDLVGMSVQVYQTLVDENRITKETTIIDLDKGKVTSQLRKKNKYLKNLYEQSKKLEPAEAAQLLKHELQQTTNAAFDITSFILLKDKKQTLSKLTDFKKNLKNDSKYELIQTLAIQMNPWLNDAIMDQSLDDVWL